MDLVVIFLIPLLLVTIEFIFFLIKGKRLYPKYVNRILDFVCIIGLPGFFLLAFDFDMDNDCCNESATFSPDHRFSIYALIVLCIIAYAYSALRKNITGPLLEVLVNTFLIIGIIFNIFLIFHLGAVIALFGIPSILMLFVITLIENHSRLIIYAQKFDRSDRSRFTIWLLNVLTYSPIVKFPVLLLFCIPVITVLISILILFGQKPDSYIRAFTDTYKHGFSQWDYMCENVTCGGHFLCSVAAGGHKNIVKPKRLGLRAGSSIVCNRQLLVSNAFEEIIEQKFSRIHVIIRKNYNRIGNMIHKYYWVFENKIVADLIYLLMKPLEFTFTVYIYLVDPNPENRIAKQYLSIEEKRSIEEQLPT